MFVLYFVILVQITATIPVVSSPDSNEFFIILFLLGELNNFFFKNSETLLGIQARSLA